MEKNQIITALKELVKPHLEYQEEEVIDQMDGSTELLNELGLDSVDLIEVVMDVEERFDIAIADEDIQNIRTLDDLVALIVSKS